MNCKQKGNCNEIDIHGAFKLCQSSSLHTLVRRLYLEVLLEIQLSTRETLLSLHSLELFIMRIRNRFKCSEYLHSSLITLGSKPYCPWKLSEFIRAYNSDTISIIVSTLHQEFRSYRLLTWIVHSIWKQGSHKSQIQCFVVIIILTLYKAIICVVVWSAL